MQIVTRTFGPLFSEKERQQMVRAGNRLMWEHSSCHINDYCCGRPGCPMSERSDLPLTFHPEEILCTTK
jgi:hypothetical protein